jgi:thiol-disulfide isomerase/thioredoxin
MSWLAVPHEAEDVKCRLTKKYCVDSVPTLVILGPDGSIITKKGREKLYGDPNGLLFPWCRRSISEELGHQFYKSATNISSDEKCTSSKTITTVNIKNLFTNNRHVALYFTAKWCSPCKPFTGIFMKYCDSLKERYGAACDLQVIICSMDQEEIEFQDLFLKTCPDWLAIPHYEKWRVEALSERFNVENIPHVVLIAPDTSIVNFSARRKIEMNPSAIGFPECLHSPLIENLGTTTKSFGYDLNQKPALVLFMENATPEQQMAVIKKVEPFAITLARNKVSYFCNYYP